MKSKPFKLSEIVDSAQSASDLLKARCDFTIDQSSQTNKEICEAMNLGRARVQELINKALADGVMEKVTKRVGKNVSPSYRVKKH